MFTKRRLQIAKKEAAKWLGRAMKTTSSSRYSMEERGKINSFAQALESAMDGNDTGKIEDRTKMLKKAVDGPMPFYFKHAVRETVLSVLVAFALAMVLRAEIVQASYVPTGSMKPTIEEGDQLVVDKISYGLRSPISGNRLAFSLPKRGDIVVFEYPGDPSVDYVKRLIGQPGDVLRFKGMELSINGEIVPKKKIGVRHTTSGRLDVYEETLGDVKHKVMYRPKAAGHLNFNPALAALGDACTLEPDGAMTCRVPEDSYFFMGDNRDNSNDSRFWGFVPKQRLLGKALFVHFAWPPTKLGRVGTVLR